MVHVLLGSLLVLAFMWNQVVQVHPPHHSTGPSGTMCPDSPQTLRSRSRSTRKVLTAPPNSDRASVRLAGAGLIQPPNMQDPEDPLWNALVPDTPQDTLRGLNGIFWYKFNPWSNTPWHWVRPPPPERSSLPAYVVLATSEKTAW